MITPEQIKRETSKLYGELYNLGLRPWMSLQEISQLLGISIPSISQSVNYILKRDPSMQESVKYEKRDTGGKMYTTKLISVDIVCMIALRKTVGTEVTIFHPLVEIDLLNRYPDVKHHIPCDAGIIDFVCAAGEIDLLVECKVEPFRTSHIRQLNKYIKYWRRDIGDCMGILAYPENLREQTNTLAITQTGIDVLFVEMSDEYRRKMLDEKNKIKVLFLEFMSLAMAHHFATGGKFMESK